MRDCGKISHDWDGVVMASKKKSKKQVGYLLSKGSPLSKEQKAKLKSELHSGAVRVKKDRKK